MNSILSSLARFVEAYGSNSIWFLILISSIFGVFAAWLYGLTTPQRLIKNAKNQIIASMLEGALFLDSPKVLFKSQAMLFVGALKYLCSSFTGLLALTIPVVLLLSLLSGLFGSAPLTNGSESLITFETNSPKDLFALSLIETKGVKFSSVVKDLNENKAYSKLTVENCPDSPIEVSVGARKVPINLACNSGKFIQPVVLQAGFESLIYPNTISDNTAPFKSIKIDYPEAKAPVHWLIVFSVISLVAGVIGARFLRIQI